MISAVCKNLLALYPIPKRYPEFLKSLEAETGNYATLYKIIT
jgi:hypothetical protein